MNTQWIPFHGTSMYPILREGDRLEVDMSVVDFNSGDIVLYKDSENGELVVHRVVNKRLQTKGDFAIVMDHNTPRDFLGKIVSIDRNGHNYRPVNSVLLIFFSLMRLRGWGIRKLAFLGLLLTEKLLFHPK